MATIYTIGHGTSGFADLLAILHHHGVATIVDVRSIPYSRRAPDFTKRRLEGLCAASGIGYRWMGDHLGGRPDDPALLRLDGMPDEDAIRATPGFRAALDLVAEVAGDGRIVLLCSEQAAEHCHRGRMLAPALIEAGHQVLHLRHDASAIPHQDPLDLF